MRIPIDLLTSKKTNSAMLELTTYCNLRCVYCARTQPSFTYKTKTIDLGNLDKIIASFKHRGLRNLVISGHGETTALKNWHLYVNKFFNKGFSIRIITNLSKNFSDDELLVLSRFNEIIVSCDTVDIKLFRRLRGGSEFPMLLYNMAKIRSRALESRHPLPRFRWSCVVCDKNIHKLQELVSFGIAVGVNCFIFGHLVKYPDIKRAKNVYSITELPEKQLLGIPRLFNNIFTMIKKSGGDYACTNNIMESVGEKLLKKNYRHRKRRGMTRACLSPWAEVFVHADGSVAHCCATSEKLGSLKKGKKLDEILNNAIIKEYRKGILSGELNENCRKCFLKEWIRTDALKKEVIKYLSSDK